MDEIRSSRSRLPERRVRIRLALCSRNTVVRKDVLQRLEEGQGSASNGGKGMQLQGVRPNTRSINRFCVRTSPILTHRTEPVLSESCASPRSPESSFAHN